MSVNTLIACLSKAEKRHFKMYSKLNSSNSVPKYVKLFNLLNKKSDIKEEELKSLGYNPVDKNFLGNKIIESLQLFQTDLNPEQEVLQIIGIFPLLYDKNLWTELNKKLKQAKKICNKYELLELQLILFDWELKLAKSGFIDIDHEDIMKLEKAIFKQLQYKRYLFNIKDKIDAIIGKDVNLTKPENRKKFEAVLEKHGLPDPNKLISKEALLTYHYIKCVSFISRRIFKNAKEHSKQLITLFENNKPLKRKQSIWYKKSLCKHIECCFWTQEFEDYSTTIIKINRLKTNTVEMETEIFKTVAFYSLLYNLQTGMLVQAEAQVEHIEAHWEKHEKEIQDNRKLATYYNVAVLFFLREKWEKSLEWLDKITNFHLTKARRDIQLTARILKVLVTYEIDPVEIDKAYHTVNKYLTRNKHSFEFEKALINHFRALEKNINPKEQKAIFVKFKEILEKINKLGQLGFQEVVFWVESKITGISIEEIFLEKIKKNKNRGLQTGV